MRRKIFMILAFFLTVAPVSAQRKNYVVSAVNAEPVVTEENLRSRVEFLTDPLCEGRRTGSVGATWAAGWIGEQFRQGGLLPPGGSFYQGFRTASGETGHNVIGFLPGTRREGKRYVLVTAHSDHLGILGGVLYPGADSNASGVAALLSLSEMLLCMDRLGKEYGKTFIFVALDGKEQNMAGAEALLRGLENGSLADPATGQPVRLQDIDLVVNLDQVGSSLSPLRPGRPDYLIMLSEGLGGRQELLRTVNRGPHLGLDLGFDYYGSKDFTRLFYRRVCDQKVFLDRGVPAVLFTSGITLNNNKPYDDAASLDYPVLRQRVLLVFHWLHRLAG